jgi:hypothetical protein
MQLVLMHDNIYTKYTNIQFTIKFTFYKKGSLEYSHLLKYYFKYFSRTQVFLSIFFRKTLQMNYK